MAVTDWNWKHPTELQDYPWDCAAASLAWALQAAGLPYTEDQVVAGLGPTRISPEYGLLDASGAGIVDWLAEIGVVADNDPSASWDEMIDAAGFQPMIMGGRAWYHWTGVRMGPAPAPTSLPNMLALANPSPGYRGVYQTMTPEQFAALGDFSAVWFLNWP